MKYYEGHFDNRQIWSPTLACDDNWAAAFNNGFLKPFKPENVFNRYSEGKLSKIFTTLLDLAGDKTNYSDKTSTLMIFDDLVSQIPRTKNNTCYKIARNHRHPAISDVFVSQEYSGLPTCLRKNTTCIILYGCDDGAEIKSILDQQGGRIGRNRLFRMWMKCMSVKYGFLYINKEDRHHPRYFQNFHTELDPMDFSNDHVKDMYSELIALTKDKVIEDKGENVPQKIKQQIDETVEDITEEDEVDMIEEIPEKDLTICPCKLKNMKDISELCDNGLNLLADALGLDLDITSKDELIEELRTYKLSTLKRVLLRKRKKLNNNDLK